VQSKGKPIVSRQNQRKEKIKNKITNGQAAQTADEET
jgi:hypothetical protein